MRTRAVECPNANFPRSDKIEGPMITDIAISAGYARALFPFLNNQSVVFFVYRNFNVSLLLSEGKSGIGNYLGGNVNVQFPISSPKTPFAFKQLTFTVFQLVFQNEILKYCESLRQTSRNTN